MWNNEMQMMLLEGFSYITDMLLSLMINHNLCPTNAYNKWDVFC